MPIVSVVLTSYNHEKFIGAAIESVLNQTLSDFELIISDDCSTDNSWDIIQSYKDPRIKAVRASKNARTQTFYNAVRMASGEYLAIHHSDDIWLPKKLEKQVAWLEDHPEHPLTFTWVRPLNEKGESHADAHCIFNQRNKTRFEWLRFFFFYGNALCHPSVCMRSQYARTLYSSYGPTLTNDFQFWIQTCLEQEIHIIEEALIGFRIHKKTDGGGSLKNNAHLSVELPLVLSHYLKLRSPEEWLSVFPELSENQHPDGFVPQYGFARLCLQQHQKPSYIYFGLHLLISLLGDKDLRQEIERLYGFSTPQMSCLIKQYDPFDIVNRLPAEGYFIPCYKSQPAWNASHTVFFNIAPDGNYSISLSFSDMKVSGPIDSVIFCPRQAFFCTNKITECLVNGVKSDAVPINADQELSTTQQDFFVFNIPQYQIACKNIKNETIVVSGNFNVLHELSNIESRYMRLNALVAESEKTKAHIKALPLWKQLCYSVAQNGVRLTVHKVIRHLKSLRIGVFFWNLKNKIKPGPQIRIDDTCPNRIILIAHDMHRGGAQMALLNLARELRARHEMQIQILTLQGGPLIADFNQLGCQIHLLDLPFSLTADPLPPRVDALLASLRKHNFDKAIANTVISGKLTKALKEHGIFVTSLVHELPNIIYKLNLMENARQLARHSDYIVFGGAHVRKNFPFYDEEIEKRTVVLGQGSSVPVFVSDKMPSRVALRKKLGLPKDAFIIVGCGIGEPRKGVDYFAETLVCTAEQGLFSPYFLWVGGFCDSVLEKKVLDIVSKHGLQEQFMVLDFQKDIIPFFTGADLFFLSSREDPFPTVVLDAMRLGLPCLSFRGSGGAEEMLDDGRGILVPCFDTDAAATAIREFAALPADIRNAFVLAGQRYAKEFTPERYAHQLLRLVNVKS